MTVTGNPVIDALRWAAEKLGTDSGPEALLPGLNGRKLILVTAHRRESFGEPFLELCRALRDLVDRNPDVELAYPVHLNPRVQEPVLRVLDGHSRVHLLPPLDYWDLVDLLRRCYLVLTDSGGIQEETTVLGVPCLTLRNNTERPVTVEQGTNELVGLDRERIIRAGLRLLAEPHPATRVPELWDGKAAARIVDILLDKPKV